jgi:DNA polymerase (family 10)
VRNLQYLKFGVGMARRGGLRRSEVLNTLGADAFKQSVHP